MTERILGESGSPRRRRFLVLPVLLTAAFALFWIAGASAVHDIGAFELDKNAADDPAGGADDWNNVYAQVSADANDTGDDDKCIALGAVECAFDSDPRGDSIFTTGGSKDDLDIPNWRHSDGNVPPKDEILNAYAAKYISTDAESLGDEILYFGADRWAQNGSSDFGFWFFRNDIGENADGTFSGVHTGTLATAGDILILGTFTQGGAASDIRVFKWVGTGGNATANGTVEGPTEAFEDCVPGEANDDGCGTVNDSLIPVDWPYEPAQGDAGSIPPGGFVEGGINLSDIGLAGCFRSFLAETRSSPSVDAQLKDYVLGNFEACESNLTTTPGNAATPSVPLTDSNANGLPDIGIGTGTVAVKDKATMVVSGAATWTGTLKFFICGPIASGECTTNGVQIGPAAGVTITNATTQPIDSEAANLTSAGRYCWRAEFTSGTTGVPSDTDASSGECFEVLPVTPPLDTQAVASPVNLGQPVQDNATLSGTATQPGTNGPNATYPSINATNGAPAGGVIRFTLLKADCTTLATGTGTNPQDVTVSGNNTYGPVSFTPDAAGTYHWKAQYIPAATDVNNVGSTHNAACDDTDETVVVENFPTTTTTRQFVYPQDKAKITVGGGGDLAGNVAFRLYDTLANCTANGGTPATGMLYEELGTAHVIAGPSPQFATTDNETVAITADTTVFWRVTYTSTKGSQPGSSSACVESTAVDFAGDDSSITVP
jgi:hypothetical protein